MLRILQSNCLSNFASEHLSTSLPPLPPPHTSHLAAQESASRATDGCTHTVLVEMMQHVRPTMVGRRPRIGRREQTLPSLTCKPFFTWRMELRRAFYSVVGCSILGKHVGFLLPSTYACSSWRPLIARHVSSCQWRRCGAWNFANCPRRVGRCLCCRCPSPCPTPPSGIALASKSLFPADSQPCRVAFASRC